MNEEVTQALLTICQYIRERAHHFEQLEGHCSRVENDLYDVITRILYTANPQTTTEFNTFIGVLESIKLDLYKEKPQRGRIARTA